MVPPSGVNNDLHEAVPIAVQALQGIRHDEPDPEVLVVCTGLDVGHRCPDDLRKE
jgi:hypothetical protein